MDVYGRIIGNARWTPLLAPAAAFAVLLAIGFVVDIVESDPDWLGALFAGVTWGLVPAATLWAGDELSGHLPFPRSWTRGGWGLAYLLLGLLHTAYGSSRFLAPDTWSHPLFVPVVVAWPGTAAWLDVGCPLGLLFCPQ